MLCIVFIPIITYLYTIKNQVDGIQYMLRTRTAKRKWNNLPVVSVTPQHVRVLLESIHTPISTQARIGKSYCRGCSPEQNVKLSSCCNRTLSRFNWMCKSVLWMGRDAKKEAINSTLHQGIFIHNNCCETRYAKSPSYRCIQKLLLNYICNNGTVWITKRTLFQQTCNFYDIVYCDTVNISKNQHDRQVSVDVSLALKSHSWFWIKYENIRSIWQEQLSSAFLMKQKTKNVRNLL